ncbi:MAG: hypothetical protein EWV91_12225 [Microcystis aeruginosa Ma_QC_Ca_00000000_S207]|uniref:Uncharacterized protein n=1 Tax=Microcystis aeruginosa Ma_QC_Ca_00000000_S207 TaxID=2486251 RepID=A0A552FJC7_MICAE|nr:MAG: hypothetical protein EWV91_12225 [Microcystis aeruginosa Ma_QC_Ca_00000000_S207]
MLSGCFGQIRIDNWVCGKKLFLGAGCGVWGVGFYDFHLVNYLIFREKVPEFSPRSLPYLVLFD